MGLDIGTHSVKAVELTQRGKSMEVTGFGQVELPADDPQTCADVVGELMREGGFRTRQIVTSISGKQVIIRYLQMVRMTDEELFNAIQFEAEKYVPFPIEECVIDCQRIEPEGTPSSSGNMNVLLVAARRTQVEEHLEVLREASLAPAVIDVDAFALGNAWSLVAAEGEGARTVLGLVDVGATKTNINVLMGDTSLFTREIPMGGRDFTEAIARTLGVTYDEAEELKRNPGDGVQAVQEATLGAMDDLGNEIQLSFDYFENQFEKDIEGIRYSGGGSRLPGFGESLERIFEKPTEVFDPFEGLAVNENVDAELLKSSAPQMAVAVGLAARLRKE